MGAMATVVTSGACQDYAACPPASASVQSQTEQSFHVQALPIAAHSRQRTRPSSLSCRCREHLTLHPPATFACLLLMNVHGSGCTPFRPAVLCTMHALGRMCFLGLAGLRSWRCWLYLLATCRVLGMAQFRLYLRLFCWNWWLQVLQCISADWFREVTVPYALARACGSSGRSFVLARACMQWRR